MTKDNIDYQTWKCKDCETIIRQFSTPKKCSCGSFNLRKLTYKEAESYLQQKEEIGKLRGDSKLKTLEIINQVSEILLKGEDFKAIFGRNITETYLCKKGIWEKIGESFIKVKSEEIIQSRCSNHIVSEILGKIQRQTGTDREEFEKNPINLIPCENGCYNVETKELENHKPENNFTFKHPVVYNKESNCPKFLKFINEAIYPEDVKSMQELFGFCLYRSYFLKKGFIFVGDTDTGKTTLLNILISIVGEKNKSGLSLQMISGNNQFKLTASHKKCLNAYDDLSFKDLNDIGGFKIATGGGYITAEFKFGDTFEFKNYAKLVFATNKIPIIKDIDDLAYYIRWIIFQFDNLPEQINPDLGDNLLKEESSGILNWALEGLNRLLENKKFSFSKTPEEVKAIMCRSGNPLYAFASDVLEQEEGSKITKDQMFEIYKIYVQENNLTSLSKEQLGRQLNKYAIYMSPKRSGGKGGERFWENVSVSPKWKEKDGIKGIYDTYDTYNNTIRGKNKGNNLQGYIVSKKASLVSSLDLEQFTKEEREIIKEQKLTPDQIQTLIQAREKENE